MALPLLLATHRRWRRRLALSPERHLLVPFRRIVPSAGGLVVSPASSLTSTPLLLLLLLSTSVLVFLVLGDDRIGHVRSIRIVRRRRRRRRRVRAKIVSNRFVRRGSPGRGVDVVLLSRRHDMRSVCLCSFNTTSALLVYLLLLGKKDGKKKWEKNGAKNFCVRV